MSHDADISRWIDVAATPDGGAWLAGRIAARDQTILVRVEPDGTQAFEVVPHQPANAHAVAFDASDGSVWLSSDGEVQRRDAHRHWDNVALADKMPSDLTVLAPHRVLVQQSCGQPCGTRVTVLDDLAASSTIALGVHLGRGVADGTGGAWFAIDSPDDTGLVHFDGTTWDAWSTRQRTYDGLAPHEKLPVEPRAIAPGRDGAILALGTRAVLVIGPDGRIRRTVAVRSGDRPVAGAFTDGEDLVVVDRIADGHSDPSPVLQTAARAETVPTPSWFRRTYDGRTPPLRVLAEGGAVWLAASDVIFYKLRGGAWQTLATGDAQHDAPARLRFVMSLPVNFGASWGDRSGFSFDARPEVLFLANKKSAPLGIGPFLSIGDTASRFTFGGGATVALYEGNFAVAVSAGETLVSTGDGSFAQPLFSVFAGLRPARDLYDAPIDLPYGLRFDYRPRTHDLPGTFTASLSLDAFLPVIYLALRAL